MAHEGEQYVELGAAFRTGNLCWGLLVVWKKGFISCKSSANLAEDSFPHVRVATSEAMTVPFPLAYTQHR